MLLICYNTNAQNNVSPVGINLTGLERFWTGNSLDIKNILQDIDEVHNKGIRHIRLPISFEYHFEFLSKKKFLKQVTTIIKYAKKKDMTVIICYFDNKMNKYNNFTNIITLKANWKYIAKKLRKYSKFVYYELVNEPNLYPHQWDKVVNEIVTEIREKDKKTKILIGATNYNSIYELSRKTPFPFKNIIYIFHFYEPFLFTHQGANWTGNQTSTLKIPYPFDPNTMPKLNSRAKGTAGEANYNQHAQMANKKALRNKLNWITYWARKNNVELWCTEFGTINTINKQHRLTYFKDILSLFKEQNIRCYLWEYKGNFGIYDNTTILELL